MVGEKMYPANHKTVFVLDHTPYFGIPCECLIEFDFTKSRGPGFIPLAPISKSLWTCSVEAAIEYCRIVWDIFPQGKLIRFVVSDSTAHSLNTWAQAQQNLNHILNGLSMVSVPPSPRLQSPTDYSVVHGLQAAVQSLCECSEAQHEKRNSLNENASKVLNNCRVICITSARDNASIKSVQDIFLSELVQVNKIANASDHLIPVNHCHLVIINVYPNNMENVAVTPQQLLKDASNLVSSEVHCAKAGGQIASKLTHLILSHYDLASTSVTGIPMKEEQNASSSANYDVEMFHPSHAHTALLKGFSADAGVIKEGVDYESVTLKWCTPRGCSAAEMHNCTAMHRVTPVDVNSRPSSCLINFLLNGRSVMLEMARKGGGKMISHLLAAHGGEIFIHSLVTSRSILEDPPSISEGSGGRVTDYRITDFGLLMKMNKLLPLKISNDKNVILPVDRMKARMDRFTKYWPITISTTSIFNYKMYMESLLTVMLKEILTDDEVVQCKQCIYTLITLESKHEPLQTPAIGHRGKGPKREEQYRVMWMELETYLRAHLHSDQHSRVLHCLLECRNKETDDKLKVELDQALRELDQFTKDSSSSRSGTPTPGSDLTHRATVIRATTDSPMSPPLQSTRIRPYPASRTLLDLWIAKINAESSKNKRPDFVGRITAEPISGGGSIAKLYPNLKLDGSSSNRDAMPSVVEGEGSAASSGISTVPKQVVKSLA